MLVFCFDAFICTAGCSFLPTRPSTFLAAPPSSPSRRDPEILLLLRYESFSHRVQLLRHVILLSNWDSPGSLRCFRVLGQFYSDSCAILHGTYKFENRRKVEVCNSSWNSCYHMRLFIFFRDSIKIYCYSFPFLIFSFRSHFDTLWKKKITNWKWIEFLSAPILLT